MHPKVFFSGSLSLCLPPINQEGLKLT